LPLGCDRDAPQAGMLQLTASNVRAARRAYDGAPPVIGHPPLGAACTTCHTLTGMAVPNLGFAPANPHAASDLADRVQNCRQCHVFQRVEDMAIANRFAGAPASIRKGDRLYPGAPPVVPHSLALRDNCLACHSGPSARPEIRCSHPERSNCRQCHVGGTGVAHATQAEGPLAANHTPRFR
jgi:cytochrome c-type protein NapB